MMTTLPSFFRSGTVWPHRCCCRRKVTWKGWSASQAEAQANVPHTTAKAADTKSYGQPVAETHPHLLRPGELFPGMTPSEFRLRRHRLMEKIAVHSSKASPGISNHLVVVPSASKVYMSEKIPYVFRQNSDFLYLSGCLEPDCALVLSSVPDKDLPQHVSTLFMPKRDPHSELWDGPKTKAEDAPDFFGVDAGLTLGHFGSFLERFAKEARSFYLWFDFGSGSSPQEVQRGIRDFLATSCHKVLESPRLLLHHLRLIKSAAEINLMRESCRIGSQAISATIQSSHPNVSEHDLFAKVDFECRTRGAQQLAYPPVVAGGPRSNIIHYITNNQRVLDGEMVLMDAGCEYNGYCSDITRTWPVSGRFTPPQRELYEAVLSVQADLIQICSRRPTLDELFQCMCSLLGEKLKELGILPQEFSKDQLSKAAYGFCPHHVSHYLGMDVHDTALIHRNLRLEPGMVITIEPGLYISEKKMNAPAHYRGMGVRIEDDVLVTEDGVEVLTAKCSRKVEDIENLFQNKDC